MSGTKHAGEIDFPRVVLRVGFAGTKDLTGASPHMAARLQAVFAVLGERLLEIAPGVAVKDVMPSRVAQFYSHEKLPLLRLVTGLCQGADALAARTVLKIAHETKFKESLEVELGAVLPFDIPGYRVSRETSANQAEFDELAEKCSYILVLDAAYRKPVPDTVEAKEYRSRAYRAQSTLLLRHADLIVAMGWTNGTGSAGGTLETVRSAMEFGLPIIFIHPADGHVMVIAPGDDPAEIFAKLARVRTSEYMAKAKKDWKTSVRDWVSHIVADPDPTEKSPDHGPGQKQRSGRRSKPDYAMQILTEFFGRAPDRSRAMSAASDIFGDASRRDFLRDDKRFPETLKVWLMDAVRGIPYVSRKRLETRQKLLAEVLWQKFISPFAAPGRPGPRDQPLEPYRLWNDRARTLSYYYQGNYRGVFFLNYGLAAGAVTFAAISLLVLIYGDSFDLRLVTVVLLGLGSVKLTMVGWIFLNTKLATLRNWNDRGVDYRYLAERLRAMCYLPRAGSFQPPAAVPRRNANMAVGQSAVDWLFNAIVRSVSPADLDNLVIEQVPLDKKEVPLRILRPKPRALLGSVLETWVGGQIEYHHRSTLINQRAFHVLENVGSRLNKTVIMIILVDMLLAGLLLRGWPPGIRWDLAAPVLLFLATVLPAAVASLNGIRFQADCQRLSERSETMGLILGAQAYAEEKALHWYDAPALEGEVPRHLQKMLPHSRIWKSRWVDGHALAQDIDTACTSATDPDSWTPPVLRFAESVAEIFVQEVAEWTVLYAKELPEP